MKSLKILSLGFIALATVVTSCKDKKDEVVVARATLAQKSWKLTAATVQIGSTPVTNELTNMPACERDNLLILRANGIGETNEGATKCDPTDPQIDPLTWSLTTNDTKIIIDGDESNIEELNTTTLKISNTEVFLGTTYKSVLTFTAQ